MAPALFCLFAAASALRRSFKVPRPPLFFSLWTSNAILEESQNSVGYRPTKGVDFVCFRDDNWRNGSFFLKIVLIEADRFCDLY